MYRENLDFDTDTPKTMQLRTALSEQDVVSVFSTLGVQAPSQAGTAVATEYLAAIDSILKTQANRRWYRSFHREAYNDALHLGGVLTCANVLAQDQSSPSGKLVEFLTQNHDRTLDFDTDTVVEFRRQTGRFWPYLQALRTFFHRQAGDRDAELRDKRFTAALKTSVPSNVIKYAQTLSLDSPDNSLIVERPGRFDGEATKFAIILPGESQGTLIRQYRQQWMYQVHNTPDHVNVELWYEYEPITRSDIDESTVILQGQGSDPIQSFIKDRESCAVRIVKGQIDTRQIVDSKLKEQRDGAK